MIQTESEIQSLSGGEIAAYKQGKLIVSYEQLAVCYLVARYALNDQSPSFSQKFANDLSIECGMNTETFRRCVEKYKLLISGRDEDPEEVAKEFIYPKIRNTYSEFLEMKEPVVFAIAEKSFTEDNQRIGLAVAADRAANADSSKAEYIRRDKQIHNKVSMLYASLNKIYRDGSKSKRQAIAKTVREMNVSEERVTRIWNKDQILNKIK